MAQYEVHVASYYLMKGAHVAAVNRAQVVMRNYPSSPSVRNALRIQIQAYNAMGLTDLRDDAERVFQLNYQVSSTVRAPDQEAATKSWWKFW